MMPKVEIVGFINMILLILLVVGVGGNAFLLRHICLNTEKQDWNNSILDRFNEQIERAITQIESIADDVSQIRNSLNE